MFWDLKGPINGGHMRTTILNKSFLHASSVNYIAFSCYFAVLTLKLRQKRYHSHTWLKGDDGSIMVLNSSQHAYSIRPQESGT